MHLLSTKTCDGIGITTVCVVRVQILANELHRTYLPRRSPAMSSTKSQRHTNSQKCCRLVKARTLRTGEAMRDGGHGNVADTYFSLSRLPRHARGHWWWRGAPV